MKRTIGNFRIPEERLPAAFIARETIARAVAPRCNAPAVWYSPSNGFRACRDHAQDGMLLCADAGPAPFGRCDTPKF